MLVKIIHIYGNSFNKLAYIGFFIRSFFKNFFFKNIIRKKFKKISIFIRSNYKVLYRDLTYYIYIHNSNILLKKRLTPLTPYIFGSTYFIIKRKKLQLSFNYIL